MPALLKTTQIQEPSSSTVNVTLPSSGGGVTINGTTSGGVTVAVPATAGSNTVTLPAATGTALVSSTAISTAVTGTPSASNYLRGDGTWATISATSGALIRTPQVLTSGTSYTTPSNCTAIFVELWGGGGGGGGSNTAGQRMGGGGSGAYLAKYITVTASTAYTIAIGSGATGTNTSGSSGGSTTITVGATTYTAAGGSGGANLAGGAGGTATNGDVNISGMAGNPGSTNFGQSAAYPLGVGYDGNTSSAFGGCGGSIVGPWFTANGGLGRRTTEGNGSAASFYSGGGGGSLSAGSNTTGGSGTQGVMRIWEFT